VSNLAFVSKVAEKIVVEKLVSHLQEQNLLPRLQSAYRRHHSTETALLRVLSDIYAAAERQDVTLLGLLDLSAAFSCVDHDIFVRRLQAYLGKHPLGDRPTTNIKPPTHLHLHTCTYTSYVTLP